VTCSFSNVKVTSFKATSFPYCLTTFFAMIIMGASILVL
jgi:hypothetical protein